MGMVGGPPPPPGASGFVRSEVDNINNGRRGRPQSYRMDSPRSPRGKRGGRKPEPKPETPAYQPVQPIQPIQPPVYINIGGSGAYKTMNKPTYEKQVNPNGKKGKKKGQPDAMDTSGNIPAASAAPPPAPAPTPAPTKVLQLPLGTKVDKKMAR